MSLVERSSLRKRRSPKMYRGITEADKIYQEGIDAGMSPKEAAKAAQFHTGLSLITGQRMKTKGYGWQQPIAAPKTPSL